MYLSKCMDIYILYAAAVGAVREAVRFNYS